MIRLFLSIDVAGSTQYKASVKADGATGWVLFFKRFYADFPIVLDHLVGAEFKKVSPRLTVWKCLGDELIMVAEPKSAEDVTLLILALFKAMALYERKHLERLPLRLKGTAWLATFPEPNIEILVPGRNGDANTTYTDFIGPDIDLGFRISKYATPSAIAASLNLVETLLKAGNTALVNFHVVDRAVLKGVLFGRPYPIVWVRQAGADFDVMSWEIEDNPLISKAKAGATPHEKVHDTVDSVRSYLRKMHDAAVDPIAFDVP